MNAISSYLLGQFFKLGILNTTIRNNYLHRKLKENILIFQELYLGTRLVTKYPFD